jgi:hypothetical protein
MKKISLSKAKQKAWSAFSLWVRLSVVDEYGYASCVTCGSRKQYKELQAGHFIPGRSNSVLFSEDGVHPQCYGCNIGKGGNWPAYYEYMLKMYGQEVIDELLIKRHEIVKYKTWDYEEIERKYKAKLEGLGGLIS